MAARIYQTQITVPAGTLPTAPMSQAWVTEDNTIADIELEIPPGHNGFTGIRVIKGDTTILPYNMGTWIIANDVSRIFPVNDYIPTGDMKIIAYNQGQYAHTFYLRMTVSDYTQPSESVAGTPIVPVASGDITTAPDPLSPDALLGADTASGLASGTITASDVAPIVITPIAVPPEPVPTGL